VQVWAAPVSWDNTGLVDIRCAQPQDAAAVAGLLRHLGYPAEPSLVEARLRSLGDADCVLITEGGLIALHRIPRLAEGGAFARITALVVAPGQRGSGIATALLAAAERTARHWGCSLLEVSSGRRPGREAAHAFYQAAGFTDTNPRSARYWKRLGR
jgi:GNAT superfamily N-acetyltransferase